MQKTILITGSTDGIGLETARMLLAQGYHVLLHGRSLEKVQNTEKTLLGEETCRGKITHYVADLSNMADVEALTKMVIANHDQIDVLINNAGVFKAATTITVDGLDLRFAVNTIAPFLLTQRLLPLFSKAGRVINLSSAAQSPVDLDALLGNKIIAEDFSAYAQSKLAIASWSRVVAERYPKLLIFAVNPGSLLGSKMVKDNFGIAGSDISIGARVVSRLACGEGDDAFSGEYFDNDIGRFSEPHPDGLDSEKNQALVRAIENKLAQLGL